jgi:transcriptional regulator with XRE-family HTH domain
MKAALILRRARVAAGLTQRSLALRAGIPQSVLSAYERGRREPSVAAALKILEAAGFTLTLSRRVDEARAGALLPELLRLADALPRRRQGNLTYPRLP